jgi:toxin ParE1/3/4
VANSRRFYVRRSAEADIAGAVQWYREKRPGLELEFLADVERAFAQIHDSPERWPVWRADRPYRRHLLRRFPFVVFYRVTETYVRVAAVAHTSRRPGYWLR